MKLQKTHIKNFKCFTDYQLVFGNKVTIFIGKNGSGKTSLLKAIKKGLSFMFAKKGSLTKTLSDSNNCNVRPFNLWDVRFSENERAFQFPVEIDYSASFGEINLNWTFHKTNDAGGLHSSLYKDALHEVQSHYATPDAGLPVLAFFSDCYPHIKSNQGSKAKQLVAMNLPPRDFGYYAWDDDTNCAELWQLRYIKAFNALSDLKDDIELKSDGLKNGAQQDQYNAYKKELDFINHRILKFTEPLRPEMLTINAEFQIRRVSVNRPDKKSFNIEFFFTNGNSMFFDALPQGYNRLLSIVFEIAYRSFMLNKDTEPRGIVMIDELDLHLHPTLQQEVLNRLVKTFPEIQFIVSTHSPLVISNIKVDENNKLIRLVHDGTEYYPEIIGNVYGLDYTSSLMDVMESDYRPSKIDNLINSYLILKLRDKTDAAQEVWDKIFDIVGNDNERIKEEIKKKLAANQ